MFVNGGHASDPDPPDPEPDGETDESADLYDVLGVDPGASADELRAAYLAQAKRWHPDVQVNATPAERQEAAGRFRAVRRAWTCLSDPDERAAYDRHRSTGRSAPAGSHRARPMPEPGPPPGERRPSTWLARAALSAVASRLESVDLADDAVTQASAAVYRTARRELDDDEPAADRAAAQRRAYVATRRAQSAFDADTSDFRRTPVLAGLVGESLWVMGHELWAELAPEARRGLVEPSDSVAAGAETAGVCSVCGRSPSAPFAFRVIRGRVLAWQSRPIAGTFCRDCALGIGRDAQHVTLNSGWWGILAVLRTPLALRANGRELGRAEAMGPPQGEPARRRAPLEPGAPVLSRGVSGLVLFGLLVLVVLACLRFVV